MAPFPSGAGREWLNSLGHNAIRVSFPTATTGDDKPALVQRQSAPTATVTVVSDSGGGGGTNLSGGAIAGIVIGSVVGVLLLLWIIRSCLNLGAPPQEREKWYNDVDAAPHRHSHSRSHRSRSRRRRSSSMSMPPPVIIADGVGAPRRSRSGHVRRERSPRRVYEQRDRDRGRRYV